MDLGESPRNKDGRHFHGNEARGKKWFCFSLHIFHTDHNKKIHCTFNVQWNEWVEKLAKQFFDQHLPLSVLGIQLIIVYHFLENANSTEILQGMTLLMKVSMGLKKLSWRYIHVSMVMYDTRCYCVTDMWDWEASVTSRVLVDVKY